MGAPLGFKSQRERMFMKSNTKNVELVNRFIVDGDDITISDGKTKNERFFIINKMYAGSYLDENDSQNIGHEAINLFSDDNGDNYIYVNKGGVIPARYNDKVEFVILTKQYDKGCQEVLGIAKVGKQMIKEPTKKSDESIEDQAKRYKNKITYAGQTLTKIFKRNTYNGSEDNYFNNPIITFKSEVFYFPKPNKQVLIAEADSPVKESNATIYRLPKDYHFGHQSLRFYFSNQDNKTKEAFGVFEQMVNDQESLEKKNPSKVDRSRMETYGKEALSYLEAMGKIDSENTISNLLCFFLKTDRSLLKRFCKKTLGVNIKENASVEREKHGRTDVWIEDDENIVVIENKIDAGLSSPDQLQKYKKAAEKEAKDNAKKTGRPKQQIHLFIIAPNHYSKIKLDKNDCCDDFKMIKYSKIHESFNEHGSINIPSEDKEYIEKIDLYFKDFLRALSVHGENDKSAKQEATDRLFYKRLYRLSTRTTKV